MDTSNADNPPKTLPIIPRNNDNINNRTEKFHAECSQSGLYSRLKSLNITEMSCQKGGSQSFSYRHSLS